MALQSRWPFGPKQSPAPAPDDGAAPIVSIIIPSYNVEAYVRRCFDSIAAEGIDRLEIIFIDDISVDGTKDAVRAIGDPRVVLIESAAKGFAGGARNLGIAAATGRYLYFVDADDLLVKGGLTRLIEVADRDGTDVTLGARERISVGGRRKRGAPGLHGQERRRVRASSFNGGLTKIGACHGRLYRTSFIREHDLKFPAARRFDDLTFTYQVWSKDPLVSVLDVLTYAYLDRGDGTQETSQLLSEDAVRDRLGAIADHFELYNRPELAACISRGKNHQVEFGGGLMRHLEKLHLCADLVKRARLAEMISTFSKRYKTGIEAELDRLDVARYQLLWSGELDALCALNAAVARSDAIRKAARPPV